MTEKYELIKILNYLLKFILMRSASAVKRLKIIAPPQDHDLFKKLPTTKSYLVTLSP